MLARGTPGLAAALDLARKRGGVSVARSAPPESRRNSRLPSSLATQHSSHLERRSPRGAPGFPRNLTPRPPLRWRRGGAQASRSAFPRAQRTPPLRPRRGGRGVRFPGAACRDAMNGQSLARRGRGRSFSSCSTIAVGGEQYRAQCESALPRFRASALPRFHASTLGPRDNRSRQAGMFSTAARYPHQRRSSARGRRRIGPDHTKGGVPIKSTRERTPHAPARTRRRLEFSSAAPQAAPTATPPCRTRRGRRAGTCHAWPRTRPAPPCTSARSR